MKEGFFLITAFHSISFGRCPTIVPKTLATLLNKTVTRNKTLTRAEYVGTGCSTRPIAHTPLHSGSKYTKPFQTQVARGMTCLTVIVSRARRPSITFR